MIDILIADLRAARMGDRELDCRVHEVLTGQLDVQPQTWDGGFTRDGARGHGEILVDLGAERRRIRVPEYTTNTDAVQTLCLQKDICLKITVTTPKVIRVWRNFQEKPDFDLHIYEVTAWKGHENKRIGHGYHEHSLAIAVCLSLLDAQKNG